LRDVEETRIPVPSVGAVDTTEAGDTSASYLLAVLDTGRQMVDALARATSAAALKVTRAGTADAIPTLDEVLLFGVVAELGLRPNWMAASENVWGRSHDRSQAETTPSRGPTRPVEIHAGAARRCTRASSSYGDGREMACSWPPR
jgi:hypothetical protein